MLKHDTPVKPFSVPPERLSPKSCILDWIDAWGYVREDVLRLLKAYADANEGHEIERFQPQIEEVDEALRLLRHRVEWLSCYLDHTTDRLLHD